MWLNALNYTTLSTDFASPAELSLLDVRQTFEGLIDSLMELFTSALMLTRDKVINQSNKLIIKLKILSDLNLVSLNKQKQMVR